MPQSRGKLRPLKVSVSFRDFALDQLADVGDVLARPMFGGIGLYAGAVFFGIMANDTLYLKVDDSNRSRYEDVGSTAFRPYAGRDITMSYYNVPASVLEDSEELVAWALLSIRVAARSAQSRSHD